MKKIGKNKVVIFNIENFDLKPEIISQTNSTNNKHAVNFVRIFANIAHNFFFFPFHLEKKPFNGQQLTSFSTRSSKIRNVRGDF